MHSCVLAGSSIQHKYFPEDAFKDEVKDDEPSQFRLLSTTGAYPPVGCLRHTGVPAWTLSHPKYEALL
jgi:hypothetical protein